MPQETNFWFFWMAFLNHLSADLSGRLAARNGMGSSSRVQVTDYAGRPDWNISGSLTYPSTDHFFREKHVSM